MNATDWTQLLHPDYESIEEMLNHLYNVKQMSLHDISLFIGADRVPLTRKMREIGLEIKPKGRPISNGKEKFDYREARPDNFFENSRAGEKRDCSNYADCLCVAAIQDDYCLNCDNCDGQPQMNHFLMHEMILDFEDHHVEGDLSVPWHPTDKPTKRKYDLNKPSDIRKLIKKHNLSDRPMQAKEFRFFRFQRG